MRKHAVALTAALLILMTVLPVIAQSRSVYWRQWDVTISNVDTTANRFDVLEYYDIDFTGTFSFGSAVIEYTNIERIDNIAVSQSGEHLRESCSNSPGTYCIERESNAVSILYYFFEPITSGREQFEISYTVSGALRIYPGGDQLWWTAIPSEHYGFSIGSSTVTVNMPPGYGPREGIDPVETYGASTTMDVRGTVITARTTQTVSGDEFLEIRVQYPHNPNARVPGWQPNFDEERLYEETTKPLIDLGAIALSILLLLGGAMGVYALWYLRGRDPKVGPVPTFLSEPPGELPPAIVGTLLDEKADMRDVISTIVDLARRGYLVMEEQKREGLFGLGRTSEFAFKRTDRALNDLRPFERRLAETLFSGGRLERSLDSLRNTFYVFVPQLQADLYDAVVSEGLFTTRPSTTRGIWSGVGGLLVAGALFVGFLIFSGGETLSGALACIPASIGAVGVLALIVGQHMPAKTRRGAEEAAKWRAFREYLQNLDKYGDIEAAAGHFDDYLPYATAFGIDRSWVRRFSRMQQVPIPPWYYPTYMGGPWSGGYHPGTPLHRPQFGTGGSSLPGELARAGDGGLDDISKGLAGGLENISSGLTTMLDSAARVMTSRPQPQSSGSSGRWSSGGRSWSGGGFRGGGSSGGGRRGFG